MSDKMGEMVEVWSSVAGGVRCAALNRVWDAAYGAAFAQMAMNRAVDTHEEMDKQSALVADTAVKMAEPRIRYRREPSS